MITITRITGKKALLGMLISLACIVIAVVIISGEVFSRAYLEPWRHEYHKRFTDPRMQLVAHGLLAANGHNMQPWQIRLEDDPTSFLLYADERRMNPEIDPEARQLMITQGTFLEYVMLAGGQMGYKVNIVLFPEGEPDSKGSPLSIKTHPVARITLIKTDPRPDRLYARMFEPDTARVRYLDAPLANQQIQMLQGLKNVGSAKIEIISDAEDRSRLQAFAWRGAKIEADLSRANKANAGLFRANAWHKNKYRYGFSMEGQAISGVKLNIMQALLTLAPSLNNPKAASEMFLKQTQDMLKHTPAYAIIRTTGNSRTGQVQSGMLYSRFQLTAQSLGLAVQPMSQALEEYPEMAEVRAAVHKHYAKPDETIQMLVRIGVPTSKVPHTMRRDAADLLLK